MEPLRPTCTLRVAVVGNRRFHGDTDGATAGHAASQATIRAAAAACSESWRVVVSALLDCLAEPLPPDDDGEPAALRDLYRPGPPRLVVLSSLAAGADQIGAETALDLRNSSDVQIGLQAVLPFAAEHYPGTGPEPNPEFRPAEAATLRRLVDAAEQVVRIDGVYGTEPERREAYRAARDLLLDNADLLVAVYDPHADGSAAGTRETVARALAQGLPVLAILACSGEARMAFYGSADDAPPDGDSEWARAEPVAARSWRHAVAGRTACVLSLPDARRARGADTAARPAHRADCP